MTTATEAKTIDITLTIDGQTITGYLAYPSEITEDEITRRVGAAAKEILTRHFYVESKRAAADDQ